MSNEPKPDPTPPTTTAWLIFNAILVLLGLGLIAFAATY